MISNRQWYWLRNVVSAAYFASVHETIGCNSHMAATVYGVRPVALIY